MSSSERLKKIRKEIGLTQQEMAKTIGLKQANLRDIELGKVKFSTLHAIAIEYVHRVSSDWLMNGVGEVFINSIEEQNTNRGLDGVENAELLKQFRNKKAAKRIINKLSNLENLSEGLFEKAESEIDRLIENAEIVVGEQVKKAVS